MLASHEPQLTIRSRGMILTIRNSLASRRTLLLLASAAVSLAGCATLPSNGPTAHQVRKGAEKSTAPLQFSIVDLTPAVVEQLRAEDRALSAQVPTLSQLAVNARVDTIGPGDVLSISVFEVGVSLFSPAGASAQMAAGSFDPSAHTQLFPDLTVDTEGNVSLPYIGLIKVEGLAPHDVEVQIDRALRGKSQTPQAIVTIKKNISNTVFISGDVRKPGRFELTLNRERLLDAIASSDGSNYSAEDTVIRFSRKGRTLEERMGFIRAGSADDLELVPGDRIELIKRPRSYTTLGATDKASQTSFEYGDVSLAEAIARAGGLSDRQADASAVFLFRYDSVPDAENSGAPQLYRLNLLQPTSYLIAQRLKIRDKDVLFFANASANQPSKLVGLLQQLFTPFYTIATIGGL